MSIINNTLTAIQQQILEHALTHTQGELHWFPESVRGGARQKLLDSLQRRGLAQCFDGVWRVTVYGSNALGYSPPVSNDTLLNAPEASGNESTAGEAPPSEETQAPVSSVTSPPEKRISRTREHSKQAQVIALLKRPEGATIAHIRELTQWQVHTIRGLFAGAFRKKLGLTVLSEKSESGERVYRLG